MLPGLVGVFLPILPSIPYMFFVALIFTLIDKFQHLSGLNLIILGMIAVLSLLVDYFSGILGAKWGGASRWAIIGGLLGLIIGLILLPPFGGILGLFAGILISEIVMFRKYKKALKAATGGLLGTLAGIVINLILGVLFLVLFVVWAIR